MIRDNILDKNKNQSGFTLIEIAIVIVISGITMLMFANSVNVYTANLQREKTLDHIKVTQDALYEFYGLNGRYPCPADPTLLPSNFNYGKERCRAIADLVANPDDCTGAINNIKCIDEAAGLVRDGDLNGADDVVLIGIVPFRTLSKWVVVTPYRENHRLDGFTTYLSYSVTEHMTNKTQHDENNPANPNTGGIRVVDENGISLTVPEDSAHYVLYSHGDNRRGGYTPSGVMIENCMIPTVVIPGDPPVPADPPPGPSGAGIDVEIENCENNDAIFVKGIRSMANTSDYYDDTLVFKSIGGVPLWKISLASPAGDINGVGAETWIYNTNLGNVGVGTMNPTHKLHIVGDINVEGRTIGDSYCDGISDDCVLPNAIAGSGSSCAADEVAYGVQNNVIVCRALEWTMPAISCPVVDGDQTYLRGLSNIGNLQCCDQEGNDCCKFDGAVCTPI